MAGGITASSRFQIATRSGLLGCLVNAAGDLARMHKVLSQVRDVLEKHNLLSECDVVEEDEVLVQLPHIANVRHDRHAKLAAKQTHRDEFTDASHASRIHLDESRASGQQIILKND